MSETWLEYMTRRGWSQKVIHRYAIGGATYFDGRPCLKYVTVSPEGGKAYRAKFVDGNKPKNKWFGEIGDQKEFSLYSAGGLCAAIQKAGGALYWCSGEPDAWTLYEALGIENSTCSFGEGSIPENIVASLTECGVKYVVMYPDLDDKGFYAAWKLLKALDGSGINLQLHRLPGAMDSKFDINQLWQDVKFSKEAFDNALSSTATLEEMDLELYVPAERLKESKGLKDAPVQTSLDFGGMFAEWIEEIIRSLGSPAVREGRVERWHCPVPPHDDHNPSFRVATGKRCKMPMCTCGIQDLDPTDAWNKVAAAKGMDSWQEYKTRKLAEIGRVKPAMPNIVTTNGESVVNNLLPTEIEPLWVDSHTIYSQILDHLEGENIPDIDFIECPLEVLHEFGGFAEIMFPGKLVYIVGISGGGKTSLGETMAEKLQRLGYDFVWYGPEWSPYEMGLRSLQRARGADMISMAKHFQYAIQAQKGVPMEKRKGMPLNEDQTVTSNRAILDMANWPGRSYFLTARANRQPLAEMLNTVRALVLDRRAAGRKVVAFFFDYLQRANKGGRNNAFWSEEVIAEIKALCEELQLVGFVMVQPKKGDSEGVRDGDTLTEASGQGISDQQCNLYLAISPKYDAGQKTGYSSIKIVKNSMGKMGEVNVQNDYEHLLVIDKKARVVTINLKDGQS